MPPQVTTPYSVTDQSPDSVSYTHLDVYKRQRLDGTFGFHPKMAALKPVWEAGHLAVVAACGNPSATRSHFDAELAMELSLIHI